MHRIVIFGAGLYYQNRRHLFTNTDIAAFLDNDISKCGKILDDKEIVHPEKIKSMNYDFIVLMSKKENQTVMKTQLMELGAESGRILGFEEYDKRFLSAGSCKTSSLLSELQRRIEAETICCKTGKDIFKCYRQLKQMIGDAEGLTEDERKHLKNVCKEHWLKNIDGIILDCFWN